MTTTSSTPTHFGVRPPAVAGTFYPETSQPLRTLVTAFLQQAARSRKASAQTPPKALIVPHAGYRYSGQVAARGYARWLAAAETIQRVVLLGPAHHHQFRGIAAATATQFETPLGSIPVDVAAVDRALRLPCVEIVDAAHAQEHSIEVQLPFLQVVLSQFEIVPLVVGRTSPSDVAEVVDALWNGPETVFVVSSDLSHFHNATEAEEIDAETARLITTGHWSALSTERACGALAIQGLLPNVTARGGEIETLALTHSGAVGGPLDRVVGYGAFAITLGSGAETHQQEVAEAATSQAVSPTAQPDVDAAPEPVTPQPLSPPEQDLLLRVAVESIEHRLVTGRHLEVAIDDSPRRLREPRATFVTLRKDGTLRGCVGNVRAIAPLIQGVARSAANAAVADHRFSPLEVDELPGMSVHISILSEAIHLDVASEDDLLEMLRPGEDGLTLQYGKNFGLFLPSVWEQLPKPEQFVKHLKVKATLPEDAWSSEFQFARFTVESVSGVIPD